MAARTKRAQSALDYLITYSWALLIMGLIVAVFYFFILGTGSLASQTTCSFVSGLACQDLVFTSNSYVTSVAMYLNNAQPTALLNPVVSVNYSGVLTPGTCSPNVVLQGGAIICTVSLPQLGISAGATVNGKLRLVATLCPGAVPAKCGSASPQTFTGIFTSQASKPTPASVSAPVSIAISAQTQTPIADGSKDQLVATVNFIGGLPVIGGTVSFTETNSFATLAPVLTNADGNGNAISYISSTVAGSTSVNAIFGGVTSNILITFVATTSTTTSTSTTSIPPPLGLDGTPAGNSASSATQLIVTLTSCPQTNDVVIVLATIDSSSLRVSSITDTASPPLTWQLRQRSTADLQHDVEEWYAIASSALSSDQITIHNSGTDNMNAEVFCISGANTASLFDSNPSLPSSSSSPTGSTTPSTSVSTSNAKDFIFGLLGSQYAVSQSISYGGGYTAIAKDSAGHPNIGSEYKIVSSTQSALPVNWGLSISAYWTAMADAVESA